jgi:hypothetical protein
MPEKWWAIVTPVSIDPVGVALSRVNPLLSANLGTPKSAGEFWNYLCDRDSFFYVEIEGNVGRAFHWPEGAEHGFEFARDILNRAVAAGLCQKVPGEDMWVLNSTPVES